MDDVTKRPVELADVSLGNSKIAPHWLAKPADVCVPEYRYDMDARLLLKTEE